MPLRERDLPQPLLWRVGRAIKAGAAEVARNPRSRSAVLRIAERTSGGVMARLNLLLLALIVFVAGADHLAAPGAQALQRAAGGLVSAKRFEEEMGRLQIEQSTWSTPTRIEKVARERLGMRLPDAGHTRVLGNDVSARGGSQ